jgi:hypothetical protein
MPEQFIEFNKLTIELVWRSFVIFSEFGVRISRIFVNPVVEST